jgi:hypothetical protein
METAALRVAVGESRSGAGGGGRKDSWDALVLVIFFIE